MGPFIHLSTHAFTKYVFIANSLASVKLPSHAFGAHPPGAHSSQSAEKLAKERKKKVTPCNRLGLFLMPREGHLTMIWGFRVQGRWS